MKKTSSFLSWLALLACLFVTADGAAQVTLSLLRETSVQAVVADGTLRRLGTPAFSSSGMLIHSGDYAIDSAYIKGIYVDSTLLVSGVSLGSPAPGTDGTFFMLGEPIGNSSGQVAFHSNTSSSGNIAGVWAGGSGSLQAMALNGSSAPGTSSTFSNVELMAFNEAGQVAITADIADAPFESSKGVWLGTAGNMQMVARRGDPAPGFEEGITFTFIGSSMGLNAAGQIVFQSNTSTRVLSGTSQFTSNGLWVGTPGALQALARGGDEAPGTESGTLLSGILKFAINASGQVAFQALLSSPDPLQRGTAIFLGAPGAVRLVARSYTQADGVEPGTVWLDLGPPALNASGEIAFSASLKATNGTETRAVYVGKPGQLRMIARTGMTAPGTGEGAPFTGFAESLPLSDSGQVAFLGRLSAFSDYALFATDKAGQLHLLARDNNSVLDSPVILGGDLSSAISEGATGNGDGQRCSFDAAGRLVFRVDYGSHSTKAYYTAMFDDSAPMIPAEGQPASVAGVIGGSATFQVTALGTRTGISFQWRHNGEDMVGETGETLTLVNLTDADRGSYTVRITNSFLPSGVESQPATLSFPPLITAQPTSREFWVGTNASLEVTASGPGTLQFQWQYKASPDANFGDLSGATGATLNLLSVSASQAGFYRVRITNVDGVTMSTEATVTVAEAEQPLIQKLVYRGDLTPASLGNWFFAPAGRAVLNNQGEIAFQGGIFNAQGTFVSFHGGIYMGAPDSLGFLGYDGTDLNLSDSGTAVVTTSGFAGFGVLHGKPGEVLSLASYGTPSPGGGTFGASYSGPALNADGATAFMEGHSGFSNVWLGGPGTLTRVGQLDAPVPGLPDGVTFRIIDAVNDLAMNDAGTAVFAARLQGPEITLANDEGIWAASAAGVQSMVAEGDPAPGLGAGVVFGATSDFSFFHEPVSINAAGKIAFVGSLRGTNVNSFNDTALFAGASGGLQLVARKGSSAAGHTFAQLSGTGNVGLAPPLINSVGQVAFMALINPTSSQSIWRWTPGGAPQPIAIEGQQAPGCPSGVVFGSSDYDSPYFNVVGFNGKGQIAFTSFVAGPGLSESNRNHLGLWMTTVGGQAKLIAWLGAPFDIGGGVEKTLWELNLAVSHSGGEDGRPRVLNENGELIFTATLETWDNTGIFIAKLREEIPQIVVEHPAENALVNGDMTVDFGTEVEGIGSAVKVFTIRNTGISNLTGLAATAEGDHASDFVPAAFAQTTLAPGESTDLEVTFFPSAEGGRTATLKIASNDSNEDPFVIGLVGFGASGPRGALGFVGAAYTFHEKVGIAHIPIQRTGGSSGAVSVRVTSNFASATADDFTPVNDAVIHFAPGQTSKTVSISITDDAIDDSGEAFELTLSDPQGGATLGLQTITVVTIIDFVDTTAPVLDIQETWVQKIGSTHHFKMWLDPRDETGLGDGTFPNSSIVYYRTKLNSTAPLPDSTPWLPYEWDPNQPFELAFVCKSIVIELKAVDAAGNSSAVQRRVFKTPFPIRSAPYRSPIPLAALSFPGTGIDCKGLFGDVFTGEGYGDDILFVDRHTGTVQVQNADRALVGGFSVTGGSINDSAAADLDGDGRSDIALVVDGMLKIYLNDGPDTDGKVTFTVLAAPGIGRTGISEIRHCTVGDINLDGRPDIVVSGTGDDGSGGTVTMVAVLLNAEAAPFAHATVASAYPGSSAGVVKLGDVTGDGWLDAVMVDAATHSVLLFINKADGSFGSADDANPAARPQATPTGGDLGGLPAQALAVADVTGDGRADAVVTLHHFGSFESEDATRDMLVWQLLDSRGPAALHANELELLAERFMSEPEAIPFKSDVMLLDLTGDRFPELVFTNPFIPAAEGLPEGGVSILHMTRKLDGANQLLDFDCTIRSLATGVADPHRLASARYSANIKHDILLANGSDPRVQWIFSSTINSSKTTDLIGAASTDRDTEGTPLTNGARSYEVDVGGVIHYSLTYVNNTASDMLGAIVECRLPPSVSLESADPGHDLVSSGKSKFVRWHLDIQANTSGVVNFSVRVNSGRPKSALKLVGSLRLGGKRLAMALLPPIILQEPLELSLEVETDSDPGGLRVHVDEVITYRMRIQNRSQGAVTGFKVRIGVPANTSFVNATSDPFPEMAGRQPNYTSVTWSDLSLEPGKRIYLTLEVLVKPTATKSGTIRNGTAIVTRADGNRLTAPAAVTTIDPPLQVRVVASKSVARAGDFIDYTLTVKNWTSEAVIGTRVINYFPEGTTLVNARSRDGAGGDFTDTPWDEPSLSLTTNPYYYRTRRLLAWDVGSLNPDASIQMRYRVQILHDLPPHYMKGKVSQATEIINSNYNAMATRASGVTLFAFTPESATKASKPDADPSWLSTTKATAVRTLVTSENPLDGPVLTLTKSAVGTGQYANSSGETIQTVINDPNIATDGFVQYRLRYSNLTGAGRATGVYVRDYIPDGVLFKGFVAHDDTLVTTYNGFGFFDGKGFQIPGAGESYTDLNNNSSYDSGEPFVDANGNKKYDGIEAIRSIDFPVGDLVGGVSAEWSYMTQTTKLPGFVIISKPASVSKVTAFSYSATPGYHMAATNLLFPITGSNSVKVQVTAPASFDLSAGVIRSRGELLPGQTAALAVPFAVLGSLGINVSDMQMQWDMPKGIEMVGGEVLDSLGQIVSSFGSGILAAANGTGKRTVKVPIGNRAVGSVQYRVRLDPASSALQNRFGETKAPLIVKPILSGKFSTAAPALPAAMKIGPSASASDAGTSGTIALATTEGSLPILGGDVDAKLFVGRYAPVSVARGGKITYVMFVGNLTDEYIGQGILRMELPAGTDFISATGYRWINTEGIRSTLVDKKGGAIIRRAGRLVAWPLSEMTPREVGVVSLTVEVRSDFSGDRIEDDTCVADATNSSGKSPGRASVFVRSANASAAALEATAAVLSGMTFDPMLGAGGLSYAPFVSQEKSNGTSVMTGGADMLHLTNGSLVIQMGGGRVLVAGPPSAVWADGDSLLYFDDQIAIAAGNGASGGIDSVRLSEVPTKAAHLQFEPNQLILGLASKNTSIVAAGAGNIVAAGAGNLVAAGAGNVIGQNGATLVGPDGASLVGPDGASFVTIAQIVAAGAGNLIGVDGGTLIGADGATLVAAGAGNVIVNNGGNIVAAGAGNLIGADGASIVAAGAGNMIAQDKGRVLSLTAGRIVAAGAGNLLNGKAINPISR